MKPLALLFPVALALLSPLLAQGVVAASEPKAVPDELRADPALIARYMSHVTFLASPFLGGRLPGTKGMEIAKDYMQYSLQAAGLQPGAQSTEGPIWRQPFELPGRYDLKRSALTLGDGTELELKQDYSVPGWGAFGKVAGSLVFVGYALEEGPEGSDYVGFEGGVDLAGKVALMLRFEPMTEAGKSQFAKRGWSAAAGFEGKFKALAKRGASAVIVVNTPGADDARTKQLAHQGSWSASLLSVPVLLVTPETADRLIAQSNTGDTIASLTAQANQHGVVRELGSQVTVECQGEYRGTTAENLVGVLPGRGALAEEVVIIGGHLDHLGLGGFGSRDDNALRGKVVHPGADDNATGCSALILLAESLGEAYAELPSTTPARTIVFIAFSAEESGLNGAKHYTEHPLYPLEKTTLMINFDMIGRIENHRLEASCLSTGEGLTKFVEELAERTPITLVASPGVQASSDHWAFVQAKVPSVFVSMEGIHNDYHTSRDTADKIQPEDALWATLWVHELAFEAAVRPERFEFADPSMQGRRTPPGPKVRLGVNVAPAAGANGLAILSVTAESAAAEAGVREGDVLIRWQGEPVADLEVWRTSLMKLEPGDEVGFVVLRDGAEVALKARMKAAR